VEVDQQKKLQELEGRRPGGLHGWGTRPPPLDPDSCLHRQGLLETALLGHAAERHSLTAAGGTVAASRPGRGQGPAGCPTGVEQGVPEVEDSTAAYPEQAFLPPVTETGMSACQHGNNTSMEFTMLRLATRLKP